MAILLGPCRAAVSGVSTHLNLLFASRLATEFSLVHFQVGSEGRQESSISRVVRLLLSPLLLAATIVTHHAALVHVNTSLNRRAYWRDLAYLFVATALRKRVVYQVHGGALPQTFAGRSALFAAFLRWTLSLPDAIVVLASTELEAYRRFVPFQRVLAFPNGIDPAPYRHVVDHRRAHRRTPLKLVYIGRLAKGKGLSEALEGVARARARGIEVSLVIAGSGPEEQSLRRHALALGVAGGVCFFGVAVGADKIKLLAEADVLVLVSQSEGLPYALLEGMAAGTAVITTPVGAIPDVVAEGVHGLFVPPGDPEAIAGAIARLATDPALLSRMSSECPARITSGYSLERLAERFAELYSGMCIGGLRRRGSDCGLGRG